MSVIHHSGREITLAKQFEAYITNMSRQDPLCALEPTRAQLERATSIIEELIRLQEERRARNEQKDVGAYVGAWGG